MFAADFAEWGPPAAAVRPPPSLSAAEAYCRRLATRHYENFPIVNWFLPRELRQPFCNLYAFCRWADDLGDELRDPSQALACLDWWREELRRCYAGAAWHPVFVALRPTLVRYQLPSQPFEDLISAFQQDQFVREYETFDQLRDYCRRSADPVGRLVLHLCGCATDDRIAWSDAICTGLQLANFCQDVARDYAIGRIYLPREDYEQFGLRREQFDERRSTPQFVALMRLEVERARHYLERGWPLVSRMPGRLQIAVELFLRGGLTILKQIERQGFRVWEQRPVISRRAAAALLASAAGHCLARQVWPSRDRGRAAVSLPEVR
uniref:Squalene synthase HpnC n=1 Tax=Schlesneria paludicola TaxID=360056 RepID=A0A7C4QRQ2_9PLAN